MKFFASQKLAAFASSLFQAAGLDLAALMEKGDVNALADTLKAAKAAPTVDATALNEATEKLCIATAQIAKVEASRDSILSALETSGVKLTAPAADAKESEFADSVAAAVKARASVLAAEQLAAAGHPPISDAPVVDPTKPAAVAKPKLTGLALTRAAFAAQAQAKAHKS